MRSLMLVVLLILVVTAGCRRHPTYGVTPAPAVPSDTLNGEPRTHDSPRPPDQPARGETDSPPPPPK
jgi:hypothetical protein